MACIYVSPKFQYKPQKADVLRRASKPIDARESIHVGLKSDFVDGIYASPKSPYKTHKKIDDLRCASKCMYAREGIHVVGQNRRNWQD